MLIKRNECIICSVEPFTDMLKSGRIICHFSKCRLRWTKL